MLRKEDDIKLLKDIIVVSGSQCAFYTTKCVLAL